MATSGEFRFLTIGLLLVVVGLTGAEIAELTFEEFESWFPDDALVEVRGYVYLIEEDNPGAGATNFKIGRSDDPFERRANLQTGNPRRLTLVNYPQVRDPVACEGILKNHLSGYHSTLGGGTEWYTVRSDRTSSFKGFFTRTVNQQC